MTTLLIAEHDNNSLSEQTAKAVAAASKLGADIHVLVAGENARSAAQTAAQLAGVNKVMLAEGPAYAHQLAEPVASLIVSLAGQYDAIVAPATSRGKNLLPRVAALLDVMQISDVIAVDGPDTYQRPIYAGNAIQTVRSADAIKVLTVRTSAFQALDGEGNAPIEALSAADENALSAFVREDVAVSERPDLAASKIVVSGGRGLGSKEKFDELILPLADKLGAAIGASRAAVDAGYAANELQVGQTGKVVAPDLYIAVGISGAIQHVAGMRSARVIVAINKDADAPIFQIADYGLVGDLFQIMPDLLSALDK